MWTTAQYARPVAVVTEDVTGTSAEPTILALRAARVVLMPVAPAAQAEVATSWRDVVQSFAYDAAEMPILSRLVFGQAALALGYLGLRGALTLRARAVAHRLPTLLLGTVAAGVVVVYAWGALVFVSRTRTVPVITASLTYGHALRQYFARRQPTTLAA